jgi:hypothetical protein
MIKLDAKCAVFVTEMRHRDQYKAHLLDISSLICLLHILNGLMSNLYDMYR